MRLEPAVLSQNLALANRLLLRASEAKVVVSPSNAAAGDRLNRAEFDRLV